MTMVTHTFCMRQYGLAKKEAGYITNNSPPLETPAELFYSMSICVDVPINIGVGSFSNQQ